MKHLFRFLLAISLVSCTAKVDNATDNASIKDMPDLAGKRVAVVSGSLQDLLMSEFDPAPDLYRFATSAEVIAAVSNGKADYSVMDTPSYICSGTEEKGMEYLFSSDLVAGGLGFAFNKENATLQRDVNDFLDRIKQDGRWEAMVAKWTEGEPDKVIMPKIEMDPKGEKILVGAMPTFPFTFIQNGEYAGLEIEILETFAAETGRYLEFQIIDFSGMIAAVSTGKIDIASCMMTITEERAKQVLFSQEYYHCNSTCYCRVADAVKVKKPFFTRIKESFYNNLIQEDRWKIILDGLWETIVISFFSILFGTLFGAFICWMRLARKKWLNGVAKVFVEIVRGIPVLVLLMLMFYVVFSSSSVSARAVAIIAFAINFGAYVSEMFRTGIEGVEKGQTEAGLAMGFSKLKTFLFFIVPQAAKKVLPVYKGEAVSLIKNTSVVGYIAIMDLTKASEIIRGRTFDAFFPLIIISIIYFVLAWLFSKGVDRLTDKIA